MAPAFQKAIAAVDISEIEDRSKAVISNDNNMAFVQTRTTLRQFVAKDQDSVEIVTYAKPAQFEDPQVSATGHVYYRAGTTWKKEQFSVQSSSSYESVTTVQVTGTAPQPQKERPRRNLLIAGLIAVLFAVGATIGVMVTKYREYKHPTVPTADDEKNKPCAQSTAPRLTYM